jgi:hypothetical protein
MEYWIRFLIGGLMVSLFATVGDILKPKGFAGLFGAAPSVAFATLGLTAVAQSKTLAAIEAKSMIAGAVALLLYANGCLFLMGKCHRKALQSTVLMLPLWGLAAYALWSWFLA